MAVSPDLTQTRRSAVWRHTPIAPIADLLQEPSVTLARLYATHGAVQFLAFPAMSGIFIAYTLARGFGIGDRIGFAAAAFAVVAGGALLGIIALWFAGSVCMWRDPDSMTEDEETELGHMFMLFSYATAPFLLLLLVVVPLDFYFHRTAVFSATALPAPLWATWLMRSLILIVVSLWAVLMLRGTAAVRHESTRDAARDLMRWGAELAVIALLFGFALSASMLYW
jgi:hypothetical protein